MYLYVKREMIDFFNLVMEIVISLTLLNSLDFYNTDQNFFCSIQRKVEEANQQKKLNLDIS